MERPQVKYGGMRINKTVKNVKSHSGVGRLSNEMMIDSGASEHVVNDVRFFETIEPIQGIQVELANDTVVTATGKGTVPVDVSGSRIPLTNVHYIPDLKMNLLSCTRLDGDGITSVISRNRCKLFDRENKNSLLGSIPKRKSDGLYVTRIVMPKRITSAAVRLVIKLRRDSDPNQTRECIWHKRMGHISQGVVRHMITDGRYGMKRSKPQNVDCPTCTQTRQTKPPAIGKLIDDAQDITLYMDICGPFQKETYCGKQYFMTMTTTPHRYTNVQLMRTRDEAVQNCYDFIAWLDRNAKESVERVHTDNAKKFIEMKKTLRKVGISYTTTSAHTPESNGLAERMNRTLLDKVRALLKEAGMPDRFWGEAARHAAYLYNRSASRVLGMITPYESFFGKPPKIHNIRVFGIQAYSHIHRRIENPSYTIMRNLAYTWVQTTAYIE